MRTELCERLGIEFPIFAFTHCRDVVAAVSQAGGFGVLGAVGFSAEQLEIELRWIDEHVGDKPYGVDIVIMAISPIQHLTDMRLGRRLSAAVRLFGANALRHLVGSRTGSRDLRGRLLDLLTDGSQFSADAGQLQFRCFELPLPL